jgi:putative ABC transport system permease protein
MRTLASYREAFSVAVRSMLSSKLRSFLTLLGVILATTTLIVVMSMVHGMDVYVAEQVSDMGTDGFQVQRIPLVGDFDPKKLIELERRNPKLNAEEFQYIKSNATMTREFGMQASRNCTVRYRQQELDAVELDGVTENTGIISDIGIASGRFILNFDDQRHSPVAFIGEDVRNRFFAERDPIGKTITLDGVPFEVIGTAVKRGSVLGFSRDNFVMIPIGAFFKTFGAHPDLTFNALALDRDHLNDAQDEVRVLLRSYRHLRPNQEDTFGLLASASLVELWDRLTKVLATMAVGIVSVFMVVGGVVIMNIMLAVVTERTYEIGIRKAVGARRADIMRQFLIESSLLSACGGLAGVVLAWMLTVLVRAISPMPMAVPPSAVVIGVGVTAMVGLFFGVYPAKRAAQLDPIHALRWER